MSLLAVDGNMFLWSKFQFLFWYAVSDKNFSILYVQFIMTFCAAVKNFVDFLITTNTFVVTNMCCEFNL